ncbi:MAG: hypothetical protein M3N47_10975 [Chloroflexota bacterium]|nr:hypothetical protein [Chloroflexota bacterium]
MSIASRPGGSPVAIASAASALVFGWGVRVQLVVHVVVDIRRGADIMGCGERLDVDFQHPPVAQERDLGAAPGA